jgi:hypothetical protein
MMVNFDRNMYYIHMSTSIHTYLNISIVNVFIYYLMFATTAQKMEAHANGTLQYRLYGSSFLIMAAGHDITY